MNLARRALATSSLALALACSKPASATASKPAPAAFPAGTVLVMNDVPIRADEVEELASEYAMLEPHDTPTQLRRIALSLTIFPRIAAAAIDAGRRAGAQKLAEAYRAELKNGDMPPGPLTGPMENEHTGAFADLGFDFWRMAKDLQPGSWSPVFEAPGCFYVLRVKTRKEGSLPSLTRLTIGTFAFPYLDAATAQADIEAALDRSRLTILDDTWRDAVPAALRYRFHVESP